jgi:hypothetical protein
MSTQTADTNIGPKDLLWEGATYTLACTKFNPPLQTEGGIVKNRIPPSDDWYSSFQKRRNFDQDLNAFCTNATPEFLAKAQFTPEEFDQAKAVQLASPAKETLLFAFKLKREQTELLFLGVGANVWLSEAPADANEVTTLVFRRQGNGAWLTHFPTSTESWFNLFPVSDFKKIESLISATSIVEDSIGELASASAS